ncbi:MAG: fumarylacetoacetate hydrolase family protein [Rhodospirillales bacterium]|nr:fumarylacetoacetate hydrolase family protein [Rhodospirillales bacterium]
MKIGSYIVGGKTSYGVRVEDGIIDLGRRLGDKYADLLAVLKAFALDEAAAMADGQPADFQEADVQFLPLIPAPVNIYAAGINYMTHIRETGRDVPKTPSLFLKTQQSFVGHEQNIIRPKVSECLDYEGEFAAVIGKPGRNIPEDNWRNYVAGYTILNDGSVRDFQKRSLDQGKNFYHSSASGPWMVTLDEAPDNFASMSLTTKKNGEVRQHATVDQLCFTLPQLIAYYSQVFHFQPGDIITTGTPDGAEHYRDPPAWLVPGDEVEIEITGIGVLRNRVVDE